jgi:hypothetical protein
MPLIRPWAGSPRPTVPVLQVMGAMTAHLSMRIPRRSRDARGTRGNCSAWICRPRQAPGEWIPVRIFRARRALRRRGGSPCHGRQGCRCKRERGGKQPFPVVHHRDLLVRPRSRGDPCLARKQPGFGRAGMRMHQDTRQWKCVPSTRKSGRERRRSQAVDHLFALPADPSKDSAVQESVMKRIFVAAMLIGLADLTGAHAEVIALPAPPSNATGAFAIADPTQTGAAAMGLTATSPVPSGSSMIGNAAPAVGSASDPLSVPTSTIPTGISPDGLRSPGAMSGSASINPQAARQLPGEAANTPTQAPVTTTAQAQFAAPSMICAPAIPSTSEPSSGSLVGGISSNGC